MSKVTIMNIKFLEATKRYNRVLQIQMSNGTVVYAGQDKGDEIEVAGFDADEPETIAASQQAARSTIDHYKVWLQGGDIA